MTDELRKETERLLAPPFSQAMDPCVADYQDHIRALQSELDRLRAELAERGGQEPVAWVDVPNGDQQSPDYPGYTFHGLERLQSCGRYLLYTSPPSPRPAVPERKDISDDEFFSLPDREYWKRMGWNACIDAMLAAALEPPAQAQPRPAVPEGNLTSHQLARELLAMPEGALSASVDVSTSEADDLNRAFGEQFSGSQREADGAITLLFVDGSLNFSAPPQREADAGQARDAWQPIESLTCDHIDVLLYSADWIDPDFCPSGIREGFRNEDDQGPIFAARWDGDYWVTDEDVQPTHWRRKPRPPAALAAQAEKGGV
ncbi:hypothetical protein [Algiphilus sp.]|uniref:hypothetical protein n=1 Tax=Algiphilus sp. TaxID=1872431 RepID=UPI003BA86A35